MKQRVCGRRDAEQRLVDAKQFLEAAEILDSPDVVATNAIHAASRCEFGVDFEASIGSKESS